MIAPSPTFKATAPSKGIWSPGQKQSFNAGELKREISQDSTRTDEGIPPIWTPRSAGSSPTAERKEFRPVSFESPVLSRKARTKSDGSAQIVDAPWFNNKTNEDTIEKRLPTSNSAPGFTELPSSRLPKAQNPTITLLQKAREGQIPKGAAYIEQERTRKKNESPYTSSSDLVYQLRTEYISDSDSERPKKITPRLYDGIGPTTKDGMPIILRSEVRDSNMSQWYKKMYETIHKHRPSKHDDDEYVMVRYKQRRAKYPYVAGYLSEPEPGAYDSDATLSDNKFATLDRRRPITKESESNMSSSLPRNTSTSHYYKETYVQPARVSESYKIPPGKIENYTPGRSSISDTEAKKWWDEVMDIFDGWLDHHSALPSYNYLLNKAIARSHLEQQKRVPPTKGHLSQALKESGYESDSTLIFKRRDENAQQLSPSEQREVYKNIQRGGDVPLHGLRKLAPERPKDDADIEYFPISPTLNRIRVHKSVKPEQEILCYPLTVPPHPSEIFATYKRTAPSSNVNIPKPPRRKSSRNNSTLRLISTMKVNNKTAPALKRHDSCFTAVDKTNVKFLREKISSKLSPQINKKSELRLRNTKVEKQRNIVIKPKTTNLRKCCNKEIKPCRSCSLSSPRKSDTTSAEKQRPVSLERTFGVAKKSIDIERHPKMITSIREKSPSHIKKYVGNEINGLSTKTRVSTKKQSSKSEKSCKVSNEITKPVKRNAISPAPSTLSEKSKSTSLDSLKSSSKSSIRSLPRTITSSIKDKSKKIKKSKKDKLNVELVKENKKSIKDENTDKTLIAKKDEPKITLEQLNKQKEFVQTGSFFQNLLMRDIPSPTSSVTSKSLWMPLFQTKKPKCDPTIGALKIYLNQIKPVSESKFKSLDFVRSRSASPKFVTWKEDLHYNERERSISLPPKLEHPPTIKVNPKSQRRYDEKLIFTETSRPLSPIIKKREKEQSNIIENERLFFSETNRPLSPIIAKSLIPITKAKSPDKLIFSQTTRPVSPVIDRFSPNLTTAPNIRSPSCRKIKSFSKKRANNMENMKCAFTNIPESLSFKNTSRFKELNKFYSELERLGELERTTSSSDLQARKKHEEEIIDYDRWREVRTRERAEKELDNLYKQLNEKQKEKDFLFKPKDVETYRWKKELDRGLRIKEKSVENIKEEFEKLQREEAEKELKLKEELIYKRGVYKPLWRGNSVVNLAHTLNERRSHSEGRVASARQKIIDSEKLLTHGVGSRIWSSLSMEQVNILKNQLSEIYGNDKKFIRQPVSQPKDFSINVSLEKHSPPNYLKVRRNSDSSRTSPTMTRKEGLSELEKQKIFQSLSKEVLERQRKTFKTSLSLVLGKETRGAIAAADANVKNNELPSPRTCYSLEMSEDDCKHKDGDFVLVLTKDDSTAYKNNINETLEIWAQPKKPLIKTDALSKPTSETESGSTEGSVKTVIYNNNSGSKEKIQEKVDFFEHIKERDVYTPTIYRPADDIGDTILVDVPSSPKSLNEKKFLSQSNQDLKDLYGEKNLQKFISEPLSASRQGKYTPPPSPKLRTIIKELDRSRSLSPFKSENYDSHKKGEVSKLKSKFEDYYNHKYVLRPRRCNSDPQINNNIYIPGQQNGDVENLRLKFEYPTKAGRGRSRFRRGGVVSPIFLRAEDRFMPHINIISKIASLYSKKPVPSTENTRSSEDLALILGIPVGEVEKMRQRFDSTDKMSILGHMFTSSPNLHELRDIAQYLTGSWTAHKYPRIEDNMRCLSPNEKLIKIRPKSTSPIFPKTKISSILKSNQQRQNIDPKIHRPVARYQPPPHQRSYWQPATQTRPSVTFKEPEDPPPPPPPKGQNDIIDNKSESPRKYVENEVTIHYRTPVRQEVKEVLSEDELAKRQADAMRKIYEDERRRKYLQVSHSDNELHDMNSRRHTDNFIPSQKSPIPLNRYDDFLDDLSPKLKPRPRSPEPRLVARALYNFVGQTSRELTFKKGDVIFIRRQVDKNWYEGEINAMVGLFPANYVEIVPYDGIKTTTRKPHEGQARAKYNFIAQTHLELSLAKGELVVVTRRVDNNWFEGRIGGRKGIFPVSYVEVLVDPSQTTPTATSTPTTKPVASPASHSLLLNGSSGGKESMGSHSYIPTFPTQDLGMSYRAKPIQITGSGTYGSLKRNPLEQALHIETQNDPIPYRALYKYKPQNEDELELLEGDTVYVLEKCDDGWYVGSSERSGAFGTFPGNYVERI